MSIDMRSVPDLKISVEPVVYCQRNYNKLNKEWRGITVQLK